MLETYYRKDTLECGCDEAGRGCLAGPVVAAAVILDPDRPIAGLQDSKQLSASRRKELAEHIRSQAAAWAIGICSPEEIDRLNILRASFRAMHKAIDGLATRAGLLLIDGNRFDTYPDIPHICFVKGDGRYQAIAAASILAKTYRDQWMQELDLQHPAYGWNSNKGYPTKAHYEALELFGATPHHRKSFRLSKQLRLFE